MWLSLSHGAEQWLYIRFLLGHGDPSWTWAPGSSALEPVGAGAGAGGPTAEHACTLACKCNTPERSRVGRVQ